MDRQLLLEWIKRLLEQLEQYHRCKGGKCYRYLNPYSVLVTQQDTICLLDLEAGENAPVLRSMQSRAMREHFIRPAARRKGNTKISIDLYGFGKTVQFMLANSTIRPALTKSQENRLAKIIGKCLSEDPKKQYEEFDQIKKALSSVRVQKTKSREQKKIIAAGFLAALVLSTALVLRYRPGATQDAEEGSRDAGKESWDTEEGSRDTGKELQDTEKGLQELLLKNSTEANRQVIEKGEALELELLRCLSAAYDREGRTEDALAAYESLCRAEVQKQRLETAYLRRMALESENGYGNRLLQTGREAQERLPDFAEIAVRYLKEVCACEGISLQERAGEAERILQEFPQLEDSKEYQEIKEEIERGDVDEKNEG